MGAQLEPGAFRPEDDTRNKIISDHRGMKGQFCIKLGLFEKMKLSHFLFFKTWLLD